MIIYHIVLLYGEKAFAHDHIFHFMQYFRDRV